MPRKYTKRPKKKQTTAVAPYKKPMRYKVADVAYKAYKIARTLKRFVNTEHKYHDVINNTGISATGTIVNLTSGIAQGDTAVTRDGSSIKLARLSLRIHLTINSNATASMARIILFRGKQENGGTYTVTDILDNGTTTYQMIAPKTRTERFRTKFIYDKTSSLSINGRRDVFLDWNFKLYGHTEYSDAAGTTIENGGLYMLYISNETLNNVNFTYYSRLTFVDN